MNLPYLEKYPGDDVTFEIDCSGQLAASETITGPVQMSFEPALTGEAALYFGAPLVNDSPLVYSPSKTVPPGKVIQVKIGGGTVPDGMRQRSYSVLATFDTSLGNRAVAKTIMLVKTTKPEVFI